MEGREHNDLLQMYDVNLSGKRKRQIPEHIYRSRYSSKDYLNCVHQNGSRFGFLPLNDLAVYTGQEIIWSDVPSIVEAHHIIRHSGLPNFLAARIPVPSQLNIHAWESYLSDYWDKQIMGFH